RLPARAQAARVERHPVDAAQEQEVAGRRLPDARGRESLPEGGDHHLEMPGGQVVAPHPLEEDAAGTQALASEEEELTGKEGREAAHPGIRRLRDDHVVRRGRGLQKIPPVSDRGANARIAEDVTVEIPEEARRLDHRRLDLEDIYALDGMTGRRARGHPRP